MNGAGPDAARWLASRLGMAWSVLAIVFGAVLLVAAPLAIGEQRDGGYCESQDHPGECSNEFTAAVPGLGLVAVGVWGVKASRAFRRGAPWARRAMTGTFGLWAVGLLGIPVLGGGLGGDVSAGSLVQWFGALAVLVAIVVASARAEPLPMPATVPDPGA